MPNDGRGCLLRGFRDPKLLLFFIGYPFLLQPAAFGLKRLLNKLPVFFGVPLLFLPLLFLALLVVFLGILFQFLSDPLEVFFPALVVRPFPFFLVLSAPLMLFRRCPFFFQLKRVCLAFHIVCPSGVIVDVCAQTGHLLGVGVKFRFTGFPLEKIQKSSEILADQSPTP